MPPKIPYNEVVEDMNKVYNSLDEDENFTTTKYEEDGEYSHGVVVSRFGSWTNGLKVLGMSDKIAKEPRELSNYDKDKLEDVLVEAAKDIDGRITPETLGGYLDMPDRTAVHIVQSTFDKSFKDVRNDLGLDNYNNELELWAEQIENLSGRYTVPRFVEELNKATDSVARYEDVVPLKNYVSENKDDVYMSVSSGGKNGRRVFIRSSDYSMYDEYSDRLPDEDIASKWFKKLVSQGTSPSGAIGAIRYILQDTDEDEKLTQIKVAEQEGVTTVTVRNTYQKIGRRFNDEYEKHKEIEKEF